MAENKNKSTSGKRSGGSGSSGSSGRTPSKGASAKTRASQSGKNGKGGRTRQAQEEKRTPARSSFASQFAPYIIVVLAIFVSICIYAGDGAGIVGRAIRTFLLGMSGAVAFALPAFIIVHLIHYGRDRKQHTFGLRLLSTGGTYVFISVLLHIWAGGVHEIFSTEHWRAAQSYHGGGMIGGIVGETMLHWFGRLGAVLLAFAVLIVCVLYIFNITPRGLYILIAYKLKVYREEAEKRRAAELEAEEEPEEDAEAVPVRVGANRRERPGKAREREVPEEAPSRTHSGEPQRFHVRRKQKFSTDIPIDEEENASDALKADEPDLSREEIDERIFDEVMKRTQARMARENMAKEEGDAREAEPEEEQRPIEVLEPIETSSENTDESASLDLKKIFVNPEDADLLDRLAEAYLRPATGEGEGSGAEEETLEIERSDIDGTPKSEEKPQKREYILPPVTLLTEDTGLRDLNVKEEMHDNAVKLVETLRSFNVRTKIENVSRGPTITRYELLPEAGIRVRSLVNLVDDISLGLATTGVRIEAPIPGKPAVGIEVPNKKRATVHLRTLLEMDDFAASHSKTLCALGEDVGGEPVYLDIAKMPHLLIAGATGMGKSVCINSLIVSLLYNANPEEVKMILIDPKKVELNIYNGIPHLLVPVVSDPKKAAGSLSWAVSEMERRYGLIEAVGVRDINMFNKITANDPEYEFLPYIVIIIDELADLMMTAPDDVEDSVCRLAQKARAAGMHLIIGTQRPSVDVITGLIKANIPSRIACTVTSQVDSRTILDIAGAEKLIGKGDMLYSPVGVAKPIRVQGAFVSEEDVEKVVVFIKETNQAEAEYSDEVIAQIEKEAAKCGTGKKGAGAVVSDEGEDEDPMLRPALELAVNSGKISTSLIQRRLSLGYGRAAKLIDRLEQLGYVSAPEGQKPREVLISKEQFMEMVLKDDEALS